MRQITGCPRGRAITIPSDTTMTLQVSDAVEDAEYARILASAGAPFTPPRVCGTHRRARRASARVALTRQNERSSVAASAAGKRARAEDARMDSGPRLPSRIAHFDLDTFFVAVERVRDPSLRGKPVLVGHNGPRGVVAAASYESRVFGCRSAQPMVQALRMCPQAVVVPPDFSAYRPVSERFHAMLRETSPVVESVGIDEAYVDLTGIGDATGGAYRTAEALRARVRELESDVEARTRATNRSLDRYREESDALRAVDSRTRAKIAESGYQRGVEDAATAALTTARHCQISSFVDGRTYELLDRDEVVRAIRALADRGAK